MIALTTSSALKACRPFQEATEFVGCMRRFSNMGFCKIGMRWHYEVWGAVASNFAKDEESCHSWKRSVDMQTVDL